MDLRVCDTAGDTDLVRIEGPGVSGWCIWPDAPDVGSVADAELDVPDEVAWDDIDVGSDVASSDSGSETSTQLQVHGVVLDVDEQDVLTLRLPAGAIVLVDTAGEPPLHVVGRSVTMSVAGARVHRTNV